MALPPILSEELRRILVDCPELQSRLQLRALFTDARIAPWRAAIQYEASPDERVASVINALCDQADERGENALLLFLHVLAEAQPPGDARRSDLKDLARDLESQPPADLAALKTAPPASGTVTQADHGGTAISVGDLIHAQVAGRDIINTLASPWVIVPLVLLVVLVVIIALANLPAARANLPAPFRPRAFPKERADETLIVIATFYQTEGVVNTAPHDEIRRAIEAEAQALGFDAPTSAHLRVEVAPDRLDADDRAGAQALGDRYDASLVIWGADTGVRLSVGFYNRKQPDVAAADVHLEETARTQLAAPEEYADFVVNDLPNQLSFLALFAVGQTYAAERAYDESARIIERAVAAFERQPATTAGASEGGAAAYAYLGWLYHIPLDAPEKALARYTRALDLDPEEVHIYANRGALYSAMGDYPAAMADYTRALELDPQYAWVYMNRGGTYYQMGEYAAALDDYNRALELDPGFALAYNDRGVTHATLGDNEAAVSDFTRARELGLEDATTYYNRGNTYYALADYDAVLKDYRRVLELTSGSAEVYYYGAIAHAYLGDTSEACTWLEEALSLVPDWQDDARTDPDFDSIREAPCFQALVQE